MYVKRLINSVCSSNTYILYSDLYEGVWIIDVGDVSNIIGWLEVHNKKVKGVLLTHTHFDHIYGLNELFDYAPCARIYTCEEGQKGLFSDKLNLSKYYDKSFFYKGMNVSLLNGSSKKLWPNVKCRIYKTPGHDWSCLTYEIGSYLFTGDSYIPGKEVVTSFPKSDKIEAGNSVEKINQILQIKHNVCPGHGDILSF